LREKPTIKAACTLEETDKILCRQRTAAQDDKSKEEKQMHAITFVEFAIPLPILGGREPGREPEASMESMIMEQPLMAE
jgi:hypothetical protein